MNIQAITPKLNFKPSFASSERAAKNENGKIVKNTTRFFREDLDWDNYTDFLIDKYKNQDKVDVYCYACSDGSEPYSLAMMLIAKLGFEGAQKFFPIKARDIDDHYFERLRRGEIATKHADLDSIFDYTYSDAFIIPVPGSSFKEDDSYWNISKINPKLENTVIFEKGDLREDIKSLPKSNCVLMFRNVWPYLNIDDRQKLMRDIHKQLDETSVFVYGAHDYKYAQDLEKYLSKSHFKNIGIEYCYEKREKPCESLNHIEYLKFLHNIQN